VEHNLRGKGFQQLVRGPHVIRRWWPSGQSIIMCRRFSKGGEKKRQKAERPRPKAKLLAGSRSLRPPVLVRWMLRSIGARPYTRRTTDVSWSTKRQETTVHVRCVSVSTFLQQRSKMYSVCPRKNVVLAFEPCPKTSVVLDSVPLRFPYRPTSCHLLPRHFLPPFLLVSTAPSSSPIHNPMVALIFFPADGRPLPSLVLSFAARGGHAAWQGYAGAAKIQPSVLCSFHPRRRPTLHSRHRREGWDEEGVKSPDPAGRDAAAAGKQASDAS